MFRRIVPLLVLVLLQPATIDRCLAQDEQADAQAAPEYQAVQQVLTKYCAGCHNADDREGSLAVDTFANLAKGGERGPAFLAGDSQGSRMIRVLVGDAKPQMPPEDEPKPSAAEIQLLATWIDAGARGPSGENAAPTLIVPKIAPVEGLPNPIAAIDWSNDGRFVAVAQSGGVVIYDGEAFRGEGMPKPIHRLEEFPGKVTSVEFAVDSKSLVTASGVAGLSGEAKIWSVGEWAVQKEFRGHRDILYDATLSPDGSRLATCSYDRRITIWSVESGQPERELTGHNGAVYDLDFSPDGTVLASAAADDTCKLWSVATGERLDTLGQPLKEQYSVEFSPDGKFVVAGGADNRIRVWQFVSRTTPKINPLVHSVFAHEGPVLKIAFSPSGDRVVSISEDRSVKLWATDNYRMLRNYERQPDVGHAAIADPKSSVFLIGRTDGGIDKLAMVDVAEATAAADKTVARTATHHAADMVTVAEQEPNNTVEAAMPIEVPAKITGVIHTDGDKKASPDTDAFRFRSAAGVEWVFEVKASRDKSPLDSRLEVVDSKGARIPRVQLRAVRDSYFTFRGKDANTINDFRVFNWEEMELNEYLYANGEVVKLWLYPRGPDSGFMVYPGSGSRYGYFDTTPLSHALGEPCYIVEPHPVGTKLPPNGLPVFTLYYENDDDSRRELGADSRLFFQAPRDDEYVVRLTDVRGFEGADYRYELTARPRRPDFGVTLGGANPTVNAGSGKEFSLRAKRIDGYEGPIRIDIDGLPPGFSVTTPLIIQSGQLDAFGVIRAAADAESPAEDVAKATRVTATAVIDGKEVTHNVNNLGQIKLAAKPKVLARVQPAEGGAVPVSDDGAPLEFVIRPGQTIMMKVVVERTGFDARISFGNAESGRNLPHGLYVDNIGLNGLLVVEKQLEREFFVTAAKWVPEMTRTFHLKTGVEGGQTTQPIILHVRP